MTTPQPRPQSRALAARLAKVESPNVTYLAEDFPVFWESASGSTVTDVDGATYLDLTAAFGVAAIGHGHPAIRAAIRTQADRLMHGMGDVHPSVAKVDLCEALSAEAPCVDGQVILTGGGAEAVEAALKTACITTGRPGIVAFEGSYHGLSYGALGTTWRQDFRMPWAAQLGDCATFAPYPASSDEIADALSAFERCLAQGTAAGPVGAVIIEPIQGRGGVCVPPQGFLKQIAERTRAAGALLIADEIFTGFWRTGPRWACEAEDVVPDILVCGKALGGGMPIGACIGSPAAMAGWPPSTGEALHTSTFLGHPVVCAAATATLHVLKELNAERLVAERGAQLKNGLEDLAARHAIVREVRGRGMMLGLALETGEQCADAMVHGLQHRLILLAGGTDGNVLTITPPYVLTQAEADEALTKLDATLSACVR